MTTPSPLPLRPLRPRHREPSTILALLRVAQMKPSKLATTREIKSLNALADALDYPAASKKVIGLLDPQGIHFGIVAAVYQPTQGSTQRAAKAADVDRVAWMVWYLRFSENADGLGAEVHIMLPLAAVAALPDSEVEDRVAKKAAESARERMEELVESAHFIDDATEEITRLTQPDH